MQEKGSVRPKRLPPEYSVRVIEALGGTSDVARICGIKPQSVSEWKSFGIPRSWMFFFRERYKTLPVMKEVAIIDF